MHLTYQLIDKCVYHLYIIRLTRSLNSEGGYRIQQRGAVFFIKSLLQFTASLYFIVICLFEAQWFVDHFINLKADSINYLPCLQLVVAVPCHYTWEIVGIRYEKLDVFMLIHHWFSSIMAIAMICGLYTPFGVWYGFSMAGLVFPISFMRGFRNQYSLLYPEFTRKAFAICSWYYVALIVMNWTGQLCIIINSLLNHYNESISVWLILVMLVTMSALSYDDYLLFKSLRAYSEQRYELATILDRERQELILPDIAEGRSDTEVHPTSP